MGESIRGFILGFVQLIIIYSLCLRRGFILRFPLFLFVVAAMSLPFLTFDPGEVERARVDAAVIQGPISHPNGLAQSFAFSAIYFAIIGLETQRFTYRVGAWLLAAGCLFVVGLAVTRAAIFGAALAITFAFRGLLKRGFVPVFVLIILTTVLFESGLYDAAVSHYSERGMEDTGREELWPAAIKQISTSPIFGVGVSRVGTPHNTFLYFAASSGIVAFAFYVAFWIQAGWRSAVGGNRQEGQSSFRIPYLLFAFVTVMFSDSALVTPWVFIAFSLEASSTVMDRAQRLVLIRVGNKVRMSLSSELGSPKIMRR